MQSTMFYVVMIPLLMQRVVTQPDPSSLIMTVHNSLPNSFFRCRNHQTDEQTTNSQANQKVNVPNHFLKIFFNKHFPVRSLNYASLAPALHPTLNGNLRLADATR